jgi:hypothetical protein
VKELVKSCDVCAWTKNLHHHPHGFSQPLLIPTSPWSSIPMDFIIDLPPSCSYDSILVVVVDRLTKMVHFISCTKIITGKGTSKIFLHHVFRYHGLKILFFIVGFNLHISFENNYLSF